MPVQVAQEAMASAKHRKDLVTAIIDKKKVEIAAFGSPAAPLKRCRAKRTPAKDIMQTPSTKTPDPKSTKLANTPGSVKKSLFRDLLAISCECSMRIKSHI